MFAPLSYSGTLRLIAYPGNADYSGIETSPELQEALAESLYGISTMGSNLQLDPESVTNGLNGDAHVRFRKRVNGYPVFGTNAIAHINTNGHLMEVTDDLFGTSSLPSTANITISQAVVTCMTAVSNDGMTLVSVPSAPVLCYLYDSGSLSFSWRVPVSGKIQGIPTSRDYYVNALTGAITTYIDTTMSGLHRYIYDANNLYSTGSLARSEGQPSVGVASVDMAYVNFGKIYNYFSSVYGRDSYDGNGASLYVTVDYGLNYNNAYWSSTSRSFTFGSGYMCAPFSYVYDITCHEFFHAVTTCTSNLMYVNQSGALNEAMSDIFAAVLEADDDGGVGVNTWMMGEELGVSILRRMDDPSSVSSSYPDHMSEYINTSGDRGGIHFNCSIPSHAFYLLTVGGTQATGDSSINVQSVGIQTAADIFYDANQSYFSENCSFEEAAYATTRSAMNIGRREAAATISAWYAVGVLDSIWGADGDGWKITALGWLDFDANGYVASFDFGWAWWSQYNSANGGVYMWLCTPEKWVYTSAEMYPWYYDYKTNAWRENTDGTFN